MFSVSLEVFEFIVCVVVLDFGILTNKKSAYQWVLHLTPATCYTLWRWIQLWSALKDHRTRLMLHQPVTNVREKSSVVFFSIIGCFSLSAHYMLIRPWFVSLKSRGPAGVFTPHPHQWSTAPTRHQRFPQLVVPPGKPAMREAHVGGSEDVSKCSWGWTQGACEATNITTAQ